MNRVVRRRVEILFSLSLITSVLFTTLAPTLLRAASVPSILSYQGRLTNDSGDLLGGSGTTYYFKFSIWDVATGGSAGTNRLWPSSDPDSFSTTVRQGVFTVNIGDTANSFPHALDYDFTRDSDVYLQVEVSSNDSSFETLSPRQRISSVAFAQLAGAVSGSTTPSTFGTTTPIASSQVSIEATSTSAIPLSLRAFASQVANLFQVQNNSGTNLLFVNSSGGLFASSTFQATGATQLYSTLNVSGLTTLDQASSTRFSVFDSAYFGGSATSSFDSTGALTLITPLATSSGGTGISSYSVGDILYVNALGILSRLAAGSTGQVLKVSGGVPAWGLDSGGSGGGLWATTSASNLAIAPEVSSYVVLIGATATSTVGNIFEVLGDSLFRGLLTAYDTITAPSFTATSTTQASTFPYASSTALTVSGTGYFGTASTTNLTVSAMTAGRIPYIASAGAFTDSANLTFSGTVLTTVDIVSTGSVGIGTTTPYAKLSVSTAAQQDGNLPLFSVASTTNATLFNVLGSGNVGVGTSSPFRLLSLKAAVATAQQAIAYDDANNTDILTSSVGDMFVYPSGNDALFNNSTLWVCTGGSGNTNGCPSGTPTGQGNLIVETALGIASSTPWTALSLGADKAITTTEKALSDGATIAIDWKQGNQQLVTLGGNRTITFDGYIPGQTLRLVVCQDATGSRTLTWPAAVLWSGGTAPTLTTTANKCDVATFLTTTATGTVKVLGSTVANF